MPGLLTSFFHLGNRNWEALAYKLMTRHKYNSQWTPQIIRTTYLFRIRPPTLFVFGLFTLIKQNLRQCAYDKGIKLDTLLINQQCAHFFLWHQLWPIHGSFSLSFSSSSSCLWRKNKESSVLLISLVYTKSMNRRGDLHRCKRQLFMAFFCASSLPMLPASSLESSPRYQCLYKLIDCVDGSEHQFDHMLFLLFVVTSFKIESKVRLTWVHTLKA